MIQMYDFTVIYQTSIEMLTVSSEAISLSIILVSHLNFIE